MVIAQINQWYNKNKFKLINKMKKIHIAIATLAVFCVAFFANAVIKPDPSADINSLSYALFLYYDNGNIFADRDYEIKFDVLSEVFTPEVINEGQLKYRGDVLDVKNNVAKTFEFDPQKGNSNFKTGKVVVKAPYVPNGLRVIFYDNNNNNLVSVFVIGGSLCNDDDVCSAGAGENENNCPNDCKKQKTPTPTPIIAEEPGLLGGDSGLTSILIYVFVGLGVLVIAWFGWKWWRKRREGDFIPPTPPSSLSIPTSPQPPIPPMPGM